MIEDILVNPLKIIETPGGNVMHCMKDIDNGFNGFGEAYFSNIFFKYIKAWKRHNKMTLNIIVPKGKIRFVLYDDRDGKKIFQEIILSTENFKRLTIPPMIWFGFQGLDPSGSILLNIANIKHNPNEVERVDPDKINFNWKIK